MVVTFQDLRFWPPSFSFESIWKKTCLKLPPSFRWVQYLWNRSFFIINLGDDTLKFIKVMDRIDISCNNITHDGSTGITFTYICDLKLIVFFVGKIYPSHGSVMCYSSIFLQSLFVGFHGFLFKPGVYIWLYTGDTSPCPRNIHHMSPGQGQGKFFLPWRWMDQLQRTALIYIIELEVKSLKITSHQVIKFDFPKMGKWFNAPPYISICKNNFNVFGCCTIWSHHQATLDF